MCSFIDVFLHVFLRIRRRRSASEKACLVCVWLLSGNSGSVQLLGFLFKPNAATTSDIETRETASGAQPGPGITYLTQQQPT